MVVELVNLLKTTVEIKQRELLGSSKAYMTTT